LQYQNPSTNTQGHILHDVAKLIASEVADEGRWTCVSKPLSKEHSRVPYHPSRSGLTIFVASHKRKGKVVHKKRQTLMNYQLARMTLYQML
jgi:hypothetical protein